MKLFGIILSLFIVTGSLTAQLPNAELDSLINIYQSQSDTVKLKTLRLISGKLNRVAPDSANYYVFQTLELAKELGDRKEIARAHLQIGINAKNSGNLVGAEPYYHEAYRISEEIKDSTLMGVSLNGLGILYKKRGAFETSVKYYTSAANLFEQMTDDRSLRMLGVVYNNLGNLVKNNKEYESSLRYHRKALEIRKRRQDIKEVARSYQNMANTFMAMEELDSSMMYFNKAHTILSAEETYDMISLASLYNSWAELYQKLGQYEQAEETALKCIELSKNLNNTDDLSLGYAVLANILYKQDRIPEAENYGKIAYDMNKETGNNLARKEILGTLIKVYKVLGKFEDGLELQQELQTVNDSIFQSEKQTALFAAQAKFEVKQHEENAKIAQENLNLANEAKLARDAQVEAEKEAQRIEDADQKRILWILGIGSLLILGALILSWRANIQRKKANQQLERQQQEILIKNKSLEKANVEITRQSDEISQKNKDITDSINYAKKIQTTALPDPMELNEIFDDAFILYKPKDIISGDFYWYADAGDYAIVAVADCTGHGVPGALMSMTGLTYLTKLF